MGRGKEMHIHMHDRREMCQYGCTSSISLYELCISVISKARLRSNHPVVSCTEVCMYSVCVYLSQNHEVCMHTRAAIERPCFSRVRCISPSSLYISISRDLPADLFSPSQITLTSFFHSSLFLISFFRSYR